MKKSYFPWISLLNDPLTPRWEGSNFNNRWNNLGGIYSNVLSWSITFKHRFRSKIFGYIRENVRFSNPPLSDPPDPLYPRWEGENFNNRWNDFGGIYSNALSWSIAFKHRIGSRILGYICENVIFSSNQTPKWPLDPPLRGVKFQQ